MIDLRRRLLLVPEENGRHVRTERSQMAIMDDLSLMQPTSARCTSSGCRGAAASRPPKPRSCRLNLFISLMSFGLGLSTLGVRLQIINRWARGPRAVANPWRGMRIEWQVSSPTPIFNFDRGPTVVGRSLRVRRPRSVTHLAPRRPRRLSAGLEHAGRPANGTRGRCDEGDPGGRERTLGGAKLPRPCARGRRRQMPLPMVVGPEKPVGGHVIYTRPCAKRRSGVDLALSAVAAEGIEATGEGLASGTSSREDGRRAERRPDEIIVSKHPSTQSGLVRRDLIRAHPRSLRMPVEHIVVDRDRRTAVQRHARDEKTRPPAARRLIEHLRRRPRRRSASLHRRGPQGRWERAGPREARARRR